MTENEMLKIAIHCLSVQSEQEVCEECDIYGNCHTDCKDVAVAAIKALEEIQLYKDNKLCLIPEDVYSRQCSELDAYKEIGTVEECREAVEKQKPKKPVLRNDNGKLRKSCSVCGCFFSPLSRSCPKCGQAIDNENLEGMEG